jgi:hypothetical protein
VLEVYRRSFTLVPMEIQARALLADARLAIQKPGRQRSKPIGVNPESQCAAS